MTTVSIPVPYPLTGLIQALAVAIARWNYRRWLRSRLLCPDCEACGAELEATTEQLIQAGHYHAVVCMARVQLERRLSELCDRVTNPTFTLNRYRNVHRMLAYLRPHGIIDNREQNRVNTIHGRASKIVHSGRVNRQRAITLVRDVANLLEQLHDSNGLRVPTEVPVDHERTTEIAAVA